MSLNDSQSEQPSAQIAGDSEETALGPSRSQQGATIVKQRRKKKRHHKRYEPGNSKTLRRIKRLGYTPEHNKRGYRHRQLQLNGGSPPEEVPTLGDDGCVTSTVVSIKAEHPRKQTNQCQRRAENDNVDVSTPKKMFYTYTKVNGKSVRYLNETAEEQAARRAKYKERNRKYTARETEEQHRQRLERRRLRRIAERMKGGHVVGNRKRRSTHEVQGETLLKDMKIITVGSDEAHLETLQREYAEFNRYVKEKLQKTMETEHKQLEIAYWQHEPEQVNLPGENTHHVAAVSYSSPGGTNGYNHAKQKPPNTVLYSNDPIDPEIALLETSDDTFVPVQVIIQTCDDFDDMLEIEESA